MTLEQFTMKKYLFSSEILAIFPSLMAFTQENGVVFKCGNLNRIKKKFTRKKYKNDDQKQKLNDKKNELLELHEKCKLQLTVIKKKNIQTCRFCGEKNWNYAQIECCKCTKYYKDNNIMVHIECDDSDDENDTKYYKDNNIEYQCTKCYSDSSDSDDSETDDSDNDDSDSDNSDMIDDINNTDGDIDNRMDVDNVVVFV